MHCSSWVRSNWKKYWLISRCFEGSLQILETLLTFVFLASFSRDNFNEACKEACTNGIFFTLSDTERGGMCRFTNAHRAFHARHPARSLSLYNWKLFNMVARGGLPWRHVWKKVNKRGAWFHLFAALCTCRGASSLPSQNVMQQDRATAYSASFLSIQKYRLNIFFYPRNFVDVPSLLHKNKKQSDQAISRYLGNEQITIMMLKISFISVAVSSVLQDYFKLASVGNTAVTKKWTSAFRRAPRLYELINASGSHSGELRRARLI